MTPDVSEKSYAFGHVGEVIQKRTKMRHQYEKQLQLKMTILNYKVDQEVEKHR